MPVRGRGNGAIGARKYASEASYAPGLVHFYYSIVYGQRPCDAALDAQRDLAVPAGHGEMNGAAFLNPDVRVYLSAL
jgi:hypothetical protein